MYLDTLITLKIRILFNLYYYKIVYTFFYNVIILFKLN